MSSKRKPKYGVARNGEYFDRYNKAALGCCGKVAYTSETMARFARDGMKRINPGRHVHYYRCANLAWHLSTNPKWDGVKL